MKTAIVGVLALLVGLGIGFGISIPRMNAAKNQLEAVQSELADMKGQMEASQAEFAARGAELVRLTEELEAARSAAAAEGDPASTETASPSPDASEFLAQLSEALGDVENSAPRPRGDRFGEPDRRMGEGDEASREERRRSFMDDYRQRMADFLTAEIESSDDPAEKQRIASISEYMQSLMEQRRLLREAQTDEERQAVFDTMRQNAEVLRSMVEEQQDQVVRDSLERQGITSRSEQEAVIQAYKEAQNDPFFGGPFTFFGGRGYGMRGPGGPPRGGGGVP